MQVWSIDTSSIINIRRIPVTQRGLILSALDNLVNGNQLYFPPEVIGELERHDEKSDVAYTWAKKNAAKATSYGHLYTEARAILEVLPKLIDPNKVTSVDPADPYVIALAQALFGAGHVPTVVTDDYKTKPTKISLAAAAGYFGFPAVPLGLFLQAQGFVVP